jgi:surfeit locus 1 family protein
VSARSLRTLIVPGLFTLVGLAILIGLGVWQLERLHWKEGLISALDERLSAPPVALPAPVTWATLDPARDEFRRVTFTATFLNDKEAPLYSAGSAFRPDVSAPGYWIFTPARLADGHLVMVDRGYVPEGRRDPQTRPEGQVAGPIQLTGALRWPEPAGWFTPENDTVHHLWFRRDPVGMAKIEGLGPVAPFYVALEGPVPPGGLPKPGPLVGHLRNAHLQYSLTWFGLAAVLAIVFLSFAVSRRRGF